MWLHRRNERKALLEESREALVDAKNNLKKVERRGREVSTVSNALKDIRDKNHFAEALEAIILGNGGSLHHDTKS